MSDDNSPQMVFPLIEKNYGRPKESPPKEHRYLTPHEKMIAVHGRDKECRKCRFCAHLERQEYHNKVYFKCLLFGVTRGAGTDWRLKWDACGMIKETGAHEEEN